MDKILSDSSRVSDSGEINESDSDNIFRIENSEKYPSNEISRVCNSCKELDKKSEKFISGVYEAISKINKEIFEPFVDTLKAFIKERNKSPEYKEYKSYIRYGSSPDSFLESKLDEKLRNEDFEEASLIQMELKSREIKDNEPPLASKKESNTVLLVKNILSSANGEWTIKENKVLSDAFVTLNNFIQGEHPKDENGKYIHLGDWLNELLDILESRDVWKDYGDIISKCIKVLKEYKSDIG